MPVLPLVYKWIVYYRLQEDDVHSDEMITALQHPGHAYENEMELGCSCIQQDIPYPECDDGYE